MISSLPDLVAPLNEMAFLERLRARAIAFQRAHGADRVADLPGWPALLGLLQGGSLGPGDFRVRARDEKVPEVFYFAHGKARPDAVTSLLDKGASVIFRHLERHFPALDALCGDIGRRTGESCFVDAIVQTGPGGALGFHIDVEDMIVVQLEGAKRWRIHDERIVHPVDTPVVAPLPGSAPLFDDVLRTGDTLLVPSGFTHQCDNVSEGSGPNRSGANRSGAGRSVHLSFCLMPETGYHAVKALLPALADDPLFRAPLTRTADPAARAALEATLRQRLAERLGEAGWREPDEEREKY